MCGMSTYHTMKTNLNKIHSCKAKPKDELRSLYRCTFCTRAGPYSSLRMRNALACHGGYMQHVHVQIELVYEVYISKIWNGNTEVQVLRISKTHLPLIYPLHGVRVLSHKRDVPLVPEYVQPVAKKISKLRASKKKKSGLMHFISLAWYAAIRARTPVLPNLQTPVPSFIYLTHLQCCSR